MLEYSHSKCGPQPEGLHQEGLHQEGPQPEGLNQEGPQLEGLHQEGPQPERKGDQKRLTRLEKVALG